MKKIFKLLILFFVCFLPVMVDAKVNYKFDWDLYDKLFWYKENDEYNFLSYYDWDFFMSIDVYDKNGNFVKDKELTDADHENLKYSKGFDNYKRLLAYYYGELYDEETDLFYNVNYNSGTIGYYDSSQEKYVEMDFEDDLSFTKHLLGKRYDIYLKYIDKYQTYFVDYFNGYYATYMYELSTDSEYVSVLDENLNVIIDIKTNKFNPIVYAYDDLIYVAVDNDKINVYTKDGNKYDSINIVHDLIDPYTNSYCVKYVMNNFMIADNELFILYDRQWCEESRIRMRDADDALKDRLKTGISKGSITLKYTLECEVNAVSSSDGEFTYETKVDDDGRSYVELKVVPKDGYSVEEIIVTDANGERIEVINNKFYRPLNDVKIEVKYVKGEYLPIPDTFLGKSVSLIIIGLILLCLGFYTINYVRQE